MMFVPRAVKKKPPPRPASKRPVTAKPPDNEASKPTTPLPKGETEPASTVDPQKSKSQLCPGTSQESDGSTSLHVKQNLGTHINLCKSLTDQTDQEKLVQDSISKHLDTGNQLNSSTASRGVQEPCIVNSELDFARTTNKSVSPAVQDDSQLVGKPGDDGPSGVTEQDAAKKEEDKGAVKEEEKEDEEAPVISFSKNQRWPVEGSDEPVCVVCGRYGEYICSRTDADVCSLECKARNLARSIGRQTLKAGSLMELTGIPNNAPSAAAAADTPPSNPDRGEDSSKQPERVPQDEPTPMMGYTYVEHEDIEELDREQVQELRAQVEIFVEGVDIPRPIPEFSHLSLPKTVQDNLGTVGYLNPTPVQMQVIPTALMGRDTMVCAQTSSGKTASFLIPTILQMYNTVCQQTQTTDRKEPLALILTPTRELAMQIEEQAKQLMKGLPNMKTALLVGGLPLPPQLHRLRQGIQLIIATPGRLLEVIQKKGVSFESVKVLIIDEFDTMLQMGFHDQVMDIVIHLPEPHQTMLFSATIPKAREQMASSLLHNPVYVSVGTPSTPCTSVKQIVMWIEEPSKKKKLFALLQDHKHYRPPIVVFVDSKMGADLLAESIEKICGISAVSLHGDKPQTERTGILRSFLAGDHPVIVCTSILGRGIDLPGVTMVVNFDMPNSVEEYIHQIGRTGRLGSKGTAITFINNGAKHIFLEFVNTLKPLGIQLPLQLINSQHLHNQKHRHEARNVQKEKAGKGPITGYMARKRKDQTNWDNVGDLLAKRKRKHKR